MAPSARVVVEYRSHRFWDECIELGVAACKSGHKTIALRMLRAALKDIERPADEDATLAEVLYDVASVYRDWKHFKRAEMILRRAAETAVIEIGRSDLRLCRILDALSELAAMQAQKKKALRYHRRSLAVAKRVSR
jgi:hypothetical protein